eukprot:contig_7169_g1662
MHHRKQESPSRAHLRDDGCRRSAHIHVLPPLSHYHWPLPLSLTTLCLTLDRDAFCSSRGAALAPPVAVGDLMELLAGKADGRGTTLLACTVERNRGSCDRVCLLAGTTVLPSFLVTLVE